MLGMALLTNDSQNPGSYYCLIRRRFKRRRKKRSERKGNPRQTAAHTHRRRLGCLVVHFIMLRLWQAVVAKLIPKADILEYLKFNFNPLLMLVCTDATRQLFSFSVLGLTFLKHFCQVDFQIECFLAN